MLETMVEYAVLGLGIVFVATVVMVFFLFPIMLEWLFIGLCIMAVIKVLNS